MSNLRIKISVGSIEFEAEGDKSDVLEQVSSFEKDKLKMFLGVANIESDVSFGPPEGNVKDTVRGGSQPPLPLRTVAIKFANSKFPQKKWIGIFGYYLIQEGKDNFTREDLITKYSEANMKTKTRIKNLSRSIEAAIKEGWIVVLNDRDYSITEKGKRMVAQALAEEKRKDGDS